MALAILFSLTIVAAGFAVLRILCLAKQDVGFGLSPAAGLAVLATISTWAVLLGTPPLLPGVLVFGMGLTGCAFALADRSVIRNAVLSALRKQQVATANLVASLVVPAIAMGFAFSGAQVPFASRWRVAY